MVDYPPPGFHALDPTKPVTCYRRHLPHWRQEGASYFVTFRLADSLPESRLDQIRQEKEIWEKAHPNPTESDWAEYERRIVGQLETWLDQGHGACVLGARDAAAVVERALRHFDGARYDLFAFTVMPNHVHAALRPARGQALEDILHSWKGYTARELNKIWQTKGAVWQDESFDRMIRDTPHLRRIVRYIQDNPRETARACPCWVTPAWHEWLG